MQLNANKFALAAGEAVGVLYLACAILVAIAPGAATKFFGYLLHAVNLAALIDAKAMTLGGVVIGLIEVFIYTFIAFYLLAWFYNRSVK